MSNLLSGLEEMLMHGREGEPRWMVADAHSAAEASAMARRAADAAAQHGYVAISVADYERYRDTGANELDERALLIVGGFSATVPHARYALLDAAARASRPHLLLTFRVPEARALPVVREARAAYGAIAVAPPAPAAVPIDAARYVAHIARAEAFVRAGRHAAAERLLREAAAALERRQVFAWAADARVALGLVMLQRGRADEAARTFDAAATAANTGGVAPLMTRARIWQAAARCAAGRFTEAESICRAVCVTTTDAALRAWAQAELVHVLTLQARRDDTVDAVLALDDDARQVLGPVLAARVDDIAVQVLLGSGQLFAAGQRACAALTAATKAGDDSAAAIAATARLRMLGAAGDLEAAFAMLEHVRVASRAAHAPLQLARARLVMAEALRQAGDTRRADALLARARRVLPDGAASRVADAPHVVVAGPVAAADLVHLAHEDHDDREAIRQVLLRVASDLACVRLELVSADAGPVSPWLSVGTGRPAQLGGRVLEAGIVIGPEQGSGAQEIGVPVRYGARLLLALVARWPLDRSVPRHAKDLLQLAAAIAAPRADAALAHARVTAAAATAVPELVGESRLMADVRRAIVRAAAAPFSVLIEGESGVGKELVARAIHQLGPRRERHFADVNCAAIPEDLLDSELFGHARGAFTGAVADRPGLFEHADGGTLFLDEVAELSPRGQAKLLRALQQQEIRRVGESIVRRVDVRIVAAANRDMRVEAADGRFRQDLLYRLDVIHIRIPPLRERPEDVPPLAEHFWRAAITRVGSSATLTHGVMAALARYHWPGNVRELQNVMAALAVAAPPRGRVRTSLLPPAIAGATSVAATRLDDARAQFERRCIEIALAQAGGNRSKAAALLGLSRQGLLKMMNRLGIEAQ